MKIRNALIKMKSLGGTKGKYRARVVWPKICDRFIFKYAVALIVV